MILKNSTLAFVLASAVLSVFFTPRSKAGPVARTGFERGDPPWELYVPAESDADGCAFGLGKVNTHQGTSYAVLSARRSSRLGLRPKGNPVVVAPGEKYRFSAWIRTGRNWVGEAESPGVIFQCALRDALQRDLASGPLFIGLKGVSRDLAKLNGLSLQKTWGIMEGIIEIPAGATEMIPYIFVWKGSGQIYIDDLSVDKAPADSTPSPVFK